MSGILHGVAYGPNREAVIAQARESAATYFGVDPAVIRVELEDERIDELVLSQGGEHMRVGFAADFRAEVIS